MIVLKGFDCIIVELYFLNTCSLERKKIEEQIHLDHYIFISFVSQIKKYMPSSGAQWLLLIMLVVFC